MAQINQVSKDTWGRMGLLLFALVNQVLTMSGKNPLKVSDSDVYLLCTMLFTAGAAIWGFWKNNSFTKHAIAAQEHLENLKKGTTVPGQTVPAETPTPVSPENLTAVPKAAPPILDPAVTPDTETATSPTANPSNE